MIRIGTRRSRLALAQAKQVKEKIEALGFSTEICTSMSKGDLDLVSPLNSIRGSGLFTGILEKMLLDGEIDIAVHSLKDMAVECSNQLEIRAILARNDPEDILAIRTDKVVSSSPLILLPYTRIGTGSIRRQSQMKALDETTIVLDIRGNIDTRIGLLKRGHLDGIIFASAVIARMEIELPDNFTLVKLPIHQFPTAPGQGAIAVQVRKGEFPELIEINDDITNACVSAERELFAKFPAGCNNGVGLTIRPTRTGFILDSYFSFQGRHRYRMASSSLCKLKEKFLSWIGSFSFPDFQLDGSAIIFTDEDSGHKYVEKLQTFGLKAVSIPAMEWHINYGLLSNKKLLSEWQSSDWLVVTSKHAVPFLMKLNAIIPRTKFRIIANGYATADTLRKYGFPVHFVSKSGMAEIKNYLETEGKRILYLSGNHVVDSLDKFCDRVKRFQVYRTELVDITIPFIPDYIIVFSPRSANHIVKSLGKDAARCWVAIGTRTAKTLRDFGIEPLISPAPTPKGVIDIIKRRKI